MKIIHFTGIRLGASYPEWPQQADRIRRSLKELLIQLFERAQADDVDVLLSAGELFDSNTVSIRDVQTVVELSAAYPQVTLIAVPGIRDPWGPDSAYHHLLGQTPTNLKVISPGREMPVSVFERLKIYAVSRDTSSATELTLSKVSRTDDDGIHVAVVCSDEGRPQPGPEDGMVMVSPTVTQHPFDYLALADGGSAARVGQNARPACYAGAPSVHSGQGDHAAVAWLVEFGEEPYRLQQIDLNGLVRRELTLDISQMPDERAVADAILSRGDERTLMSAVLTGKRPADRPILDRVVERFCGEDLLGLHLVDRTELLAPAGTLRTDQPTLALLWDRYRQASDADRPVWADALKLYSSGVTDPETWPEAPWAR